MLFVYFVILYHNLNEEMNVFHNNNLTEQIRLEILKSEIRQ